MDNFGEAYLRLVLAINKHINGYVDAYFGPADLKAQVAVEPLSPPAALLSDLARLQDHLPAGDPARAAYLTATLRAVETTLRILNGETFDYMEEVRRLYDISPTLADESVYAKAHALLDSALPGSGDLPGRVETARRQYELSPQAILPLLEVARAETRQRTVALLASLGGLLDGEEIELRLTQNQPWSAYNWFLGNGRSLVEFNTDLPVSVLGLISTFAHEGYPGHHTELQLKEKRLYWDKGYAEHAVALLHSPSAVISEGIATTAVEMIFPPTNGGSDHHDWNMEVMLPAARQSAALAEPLEPETAKQLRRVAQASHDLRTVTANAAILYHTGRLNEEQTIEYIRTYNLSNEQRARQSFRFITNPLYRSYIFTYSQGYHLIENAASDDKANLFRRLLVEQILPSQLISPQMNTDGHRY